MKTLERYLGNPWLTLAPVVGIALAFRLTDLGAVTLTCDESQDLPAVVRHAQRLNPFDVVRISVGQHGYAHADELADTVDSSSRSEQDVGIPEIINFRG